MRQVANDIIDTLIKKLPIVIGCVDMSKLDNRTYNAVRMLKITLKRLNRINEKQKNES